MIDTQALSHPYVASADRARVRPRSVLHISTADNAGGSARSAYRIHQGLRQLGHTSRMLVRRRVTADPDVQRIWRSRTGRLADAALSRLLRSVSLPDLIAFSSAGLPRHPWFQDSDVLQLYNLHGEYFGLAALPTLARQRPVVWRLSDMWALTGHCAYSLECERWRTGCGRCPHLRDYPALRRDTTAWHWRLKRRVYARSRLTIVAPSRWLEGVAAASPLLAGQRIVRIPNGIDTDVFRPQNRHAARERLGLPTDRPLALFIHAAPRGQRKGAALLAAIAGRLARHGAELVLMGERTELLAQTLPCRSHHLGYLRQDAQLAEAYAAADMLVHPTLADNLPNCLLESLACSVPAVTFDVGGCGELVRHLDTGLLAPAGDVGAFADGIEQLLLDGALRERLGRQGRQLVEQEHTLIRQAERFARLYEGLGKERDA